jgi:hypothetical protein
VDSWLLTTFNQLNKYAEKSHNEWNINTIWDIISI